MNEKIALNLAFEPTSSKYPPDLADPAIRDVVVPSVVFSAFLSANSRLPGTNSSSAMCWT